MRISTDTIRPCRNRRAGILLHCMLCGCLLFFCLVYCLPAAVQACGYHEDTMRVGILNLIYPDSLHVNGAIWKAQQAGDLPWPDTKRLMATGSYRKALDAAAFNKTQRAIRDLGSGLGKMTLEGRSDQFALVLVSNALWSRFTVGRAFQGVVVDADGPGDIDLVVATDDPVVHAVVRGELTLSDAISSGMVKLYGERQRIDQFLRTFGGIGNQPLTISHQEKP